VPLSVPQAPVEAGGSVIWLVGGPSVGKSSIARAIQAAGGAHDPWVRAGDQHLLRVIAATSLIRHGPAVDDDWPGWTVPFEDGRVVGLPHAGPVALRLLDGMYRAAAAMAGAGNNVVLEDVVWEASIAELACAAFAGTDLFAVRVRCPTAMAVTREHARSDRFDGSVVAFATQPEPTIDVAMEIDTSDLDPSSCARQILDGFERRHLS
jgi:chloramphenicol 3-O phosphotransferase